MKLYIAENFFPLKQCSVRCNYCFGPVPDFVSADIIQTDIDRLRQKKCFTLIRVVNGPTSSAQTQK